MKCDNVERWHKIVILLDEWQNIKNYGTQCLPLVTLRVNL